MQLHHQASLQEPSVPDMSRIMNSQGADNPLMNMEMPQIPPNEVSSLLGTEENMDDHQHMTNMGYDQNEPPFLGGYDQQQNQQSPSGLSERGPATPWNQEDYDFPPSVGAVSFKFL